MGVPDEGACREMRRVGRDQCGGGPCGCHVPSAGVYAPHPSGVVTAVRGVHRIFGYAVRRRHRGLSTRRIRLHPSVMNADIVLAPGEWAARKAAHAARVGEWVAPRLDRAGRGEKHPVYDFLFTYYGQKPGRLARWEPGLGVTLAGEEARAWLAFSGYIVTPSGVTVDPAALTEKRRVFIAWLRRFLAATMERPPFFGCFGLHEWAMVYRTEEIRHALPLRLPPEELARFVESQVIRCSHYDAFRFFTPAARPLNRLQPTREAMPELEQSGCLHANMDLYKWAYKLHPFCPSELMADAFEIAVAARELDMRASAYDCSSLGFDAVPVETPEGRLRYEAEQRAISARARPVREALLELCDRLSAPPRE